MNAKNKFNPKIYAGKPRIYISVPRHPRISRLWEWNEERKEYEPKTYMVKRYNSEPSGGRKRIVRFFNTVEEGLNWQLGEEKTPALTLVPPIKEKKLRTGPFFRDVVEEWKKRAFPRIRQSTCISYENLLRLFFGSLMDLTIHEITPQRIDEWLDELKDPKGWIMQSKKRTTFKNELKLLATILNYYANYHDDDFNFVFPLKKRHRLAIKLNRSKTRSKDLKEEEFIIFREALRTLNGRWEMVAALAAVQYYQALRISEAAALHWEDVYMDWKDPAKSRVHVTRLVVWPRKKGISSYVQKGFKNADSNDGVKEQPMFPETFEAFSKLFYLGASGLIFSVEGMHLEYRVIQSAYDRAFKKVGLPYRGTHVMRHGGCRRVYNQEGDLAVAQQLLGNSDLKSTLVYAKRNASALTEVAQRHWENSSRLAANGCKETM